MSRANGKVILSGEHAVVYGLPALACGVNLGMSASAHSNGDFVLRVKDEPVPEQNEAAAAFRALCRSLGASPCQVDVAPEMPTGVGLGASAAMGVAIARAILDAGLVADVPAASCDDACSPRSPAQRDERILQAANAWEGIFHGSPSGIDAACALAGGCIRFQKGTEYRRLVLPRPLPLLIAVAGPPSSTKKMVESVALARERNRQAFEENLSAIGNLVEQAQRCLEMGDWSALGALLDHNHELLAVWMLSTPEIEKCCTLAREAGALGAKLTGAGGGGCVIALPGAGASESILSSWRAAGYQCFDSSVEVPSPTT